MPVQDQPQGGRRECSPAPLLPCSPASFKVVAEQADALAEARIDGVLYGWRWHSRGAGIGLQAKAGRLFFAQFKRALGQPFFDKPLGVPGALLREQPQSLVGGQKFNQARAGLNAINRQVTDRVHGGTVGQDQTLGAAVVIVVQPWVGIILDDDIAWTHHGLQVARQPAPVRGLELSGVEVIVLQGNSGHDQETA